MSSIRTFFEAFLILVVLVAPLARAEKDGAEGHGGEVVDIDKRPRLRDLVDKTTCAWVSATDFQATLPRFTEVLESIDRVHWYLAHTIREEMRSLSVCMTQSALKQIPEDDQEGLTIYEVDTKQLAIRLNDMIFIDGTIFKKLPADDRAYLLLHEIAHSFIPRDAKRRPSKVRNFVYAVSQNEKSAMTKEQFALQIERNDIQIVSSVVGALETYRDQIVMALDQGKSESQRLAVVAYAARALDRLLPRDQEVINVLYSPLKESMIDSVKRGDQANVARLLDLGIDPNLTADIFLIGCRKNSYYGNGDICFEKDRAEVLRKKPSIEQWRPIVPLLQLAIGLRYSNVAQLLASQSSIDVNRRGELITGEGNLEEWGSEHYYREYSSVAVKDAPPIYAASYIQDVDTVRVLVARPETDINASIRVVGEDLSNNALLSDWIGTTALHVTKSLEMLEVLLSRTDIDVNAVAQNGTTPLMGFCGVKTSESRSMLRRLLQHSSIDPNLVTTKSVLSFATEGRHCRCIRTLLENPALDPNIPDPRTAEPALHVLAKDTLLRCPNALRAMILDRRTDVSRVLSLKLDPEVKVVVQDAINERNGVKKPVPQPTPKPTPRPTPKPKSKPKSTPRPSSWED